MGELNTTRTLNLLSCINLANPTASSTNYSQSSTLFTAMNFTFSNRVIINPSDATRRANINEQR
jgi:hypothetical protein